MATEEVRLVAMSRADVGRLSELAPRMRLDESLLTDQGRADTDNALMAARVRAAWDAGITEEEAQILERQLTPIAATIAEMPPDRQPAYEPVPTLLDKLRSAFKP